MFSTKRAVATRCLGLPVRRAIESVARIGGQGIQLDVRTELNPRELSDTGRRQFLHALGQFNLQLASTFLPTRGALYDATNLDQRVSAIRSAMQFSQQLGTDVLVIAPGPLPEAESPERQTLTDILTELAAHGNHVGTTLCLRSGDASTELIELIRGIQEGPLGIDFDPAASVAAGRDMLTDYSALHRAIRHVRGTDTAIATDNSSVEVPVGRGRVPWLELMVMLTEAKYAGWIVLERTLGSRRREDLAEGLEHLKPELPV